MAEPATVRARADCAAAAATDAPPTPADLQLPQLPQVPQVSPPDPALGQRWQDCVQALCEQGTVAALVKELATQAGLRHIDHSTSPPRWHLVVAREPLRNPVLADKLAAALSAQLGEPVALEIEAGTPPDSPALRAAAERQRRQEAAEASIQQDPVVRELLAQFKGARIVPGSIKPV